MRFTSESIFAVILDFVAFGAADLSQISLGTYFFVKVFVREKKQCITKLLYVWRFIKIGDPTNHAF